MDYLGDRVVHTNKVLRWPHLKKGRVIKPGQKIHASVAFIEQEYRPKANFAEGMTWKWDVILRKGKQDQISWMKEIEGIFVLKYNEGGR
jgi:hypothetical protein